MKNLLLSYLIVLPAILMMCSDNIIVVFATTGYVLILFKLSKTMAGKRFIKRAYKEYAKIINTNNI